jgi:hypothetical protein
MLRKILFFIAGLLLFCSLSFSISERKITYPVDIMATGGAGVTSYDKFGMIFMNPAAFALSEKPRFFFLKTGVSGNFGIYNFYDIYSALSKNNNDFTQLSSAQWKKLMNLDVHIGLSGPLSLGYMWEGIGILLYNDFSTSAIVQQTSGLPYVDFGSYLDIGILIGFGFKIPLLIDLGKFSSLYGGITIKYINRLKYENQRMSVLELFDSTLGLMNFKKGLLWGQAIGSDLGLLLKSERWAFGIVLRDWFTTPFGWQEYNLNFQPIASNPPLSATYYMPSLDIGFSYKIKNVLPQYSISDLTLYFDLANVFDFTENFFLKTRLGAEIFAFKFLTLRAGLYKGYLTAGFGINTGFMTINAAYFTEEHGGLPGSKPEEIYTIETQFII